MEKVLLSKKNCHRAATVSEANNINAPVLEFKFRAHEISRNFFTSQRAHVVGDDIIVNDNERDMSKWEVVSWKYEENFEGMWDLAVRAFSGTSYSPEERARMYINDYEDLLQKDLNAIPKEEHERYIAKFREWVRTLFEKHSRILSIMITGPARFPNKRNEKANNSYDAAVNEFFEWRKRAAKVIERKIENAKSPEQKENEQWVSLKRDMDFNIGTCVEIDTGKNNYSYRPAFTNSIFGKIERLANNGKINLVLKALDYIKQIQEDEKIGLKKPLFTSRHKIWKLKEVCEQAIQKKEELNNKESNEIEFDGGKVVKNYSEDRLQILFDEKPAPEMISTLKHNGFRWSPRFKAWQRQLTSNAFYACERVLKISVRN